jgi:very-short-patch-repair endonuclease
MGRGSRKPEPERKPRDSHKPDARFFRRAHITDKDKDWRRRFLKDCESPAETAFLEAMISGFGLLPKLGKLHGQALFLNFQVEIAPYRVDFFANNWLVIEIDGAAYHSSPEAVTRDAIRDKFMIGRGYAVLRIPAKVVFNTPTEAVRRVRSAIAAGIPKPIIKEPPPKKLSFFEVIGDLSSRFDAEMALTEVKGSFEEEKKVIDASVEAASRWLKAEDESGKSPEEFSKSMEESSRWLEEMMLKSGNGGRQIDTIIPIPVISPPSPHKDPVVDANIKRMYAQFLTDREEYFGGIRRQIRSNPRLPPHVKPTLQKFGWLRYWDRIS